MAKCKTSKVCGAVNLFPLNCFHSLQGVVVGRLGRALAGAHYRESFKAVKLYPQNEKHENSTRCLCVDCRVNARHLQIQKVGRVGNKIKVDVKRFMLIFQIIKQSNFSLPGAGFAPPFRPLFWHVTLRRLVLHPHQLTTEKPIRVEKC